MLGIGFEERCCAYPKILADARVPAGKHSFYCVLPPDDNCSWALKACRERHAREIHNLLPASRTLSIDQMVEEALSAGAIENFCVDISSLPRAFIFRILQELREKSEGGTRVWIIYTNPEVYDHGSLQEPGPGARPFFNAPKLRPGEKSAALILPGFDVEYTNVALTYLRAATGVDPQITWLIPFPGAKFAFYERTLESHGGLIGEANFRLLLQYEINHATMSLRQEIKALDQFPVWFVPLGCRITCVPVLLSVLWAKQQSINVNILLPETRVYNSIRSEGARPPLVEQIQFVEPSG